MQARVTRMIASVGSMMSASGTLSIRTSWAPGMMVARILFCSLEVEILLVSDVLHPRNGRAVQRFLDGDVGHGSAVSRSMPVSVVRRAPNHVASADLDALLVFALGPPDASSDDKCLPERMAVPGSSRAWLKRHAGAADPRRFGRVAERLDCHIAGEPFRRTLLRRTRSRPLQF